MAWLTALYFAGAYLRLYPPRPRSGRTWLAGSLGFVAVTLMFRLTADCLGGSAYSGWVLAYPSPLVVGAAVCLFQACREARCAPAVRRVVGLCAPASFGVYLLHAQPFVFHRLLNGAVVPLLRVPAWQFALAIPGLAMAIFCAGIAVDWARIAVFRLLRLDRLAQSAGDALQRRLPPLE